MFLRFQKIEVEGFLGQCHYVIPLDQAERVTIIRGPNGAGKTRLMELVASLAGVTKEGSAGAGADYYRRLRLEADGLSVEYVDGTADHVGVEFDKQPLLSARLIDTERSLRNSKYCGTNDLIMSAFRACRMAHVNTTQRLDQLMMQRLVGPVAPQMSEVTLALRMEKNQEQWAWLSRLGIFTSGAMPTITLQQLQQLDAPTRGALEAITADTAEKISVFTTFATRLDLLLQTLNNMFDKTVHFDERRGLVVTDYPIGELALDDLSAGEQSLLIMLVRLLFGNQVNELIMIDTPESALHVNWTLQLVDVLIQIAETAQIDILLATHSLDICAEHEELVVELKNKGE